MLWLYSAATFKTILRCLYRSDSKRVEVGLLLPSAFSTLYLMIRIAAKKISVANGAALHPAIGS
jgi:hypothetical protein